MTEEFEASELVPLGVDDFSAMNSGVVLSSKMNNDRKDPVKNDDFSGFAVNDEDTPF